MIGSTKTPLHLVPALTGDQLVDGPSTAAVIHLPVLDGSRRTPAGRRLARLRVAGERGMATAEYAVGLIAACAFAMVLYVVVKDESIRMGLVNVALKALSLANPK